MQVEVSSVARGDHGGITAALAVMRPSSCQVQPVDRMMIAITPANSFFMVASFPFGHIKTVVAREGMCNGRCREIYARGWGKKVLSAGNAGQNGCGCWE